jgi:hypothetical protein
MRYIMSSSEEADEEQQHPVLQLRAALAALALARAAGDAAAADAHHARAAALEATVPVGSRAPVLLDVLGLASAVGFERECAPLVGVCRAAWRNELDGLLWPRVVNLRLGSPECEWRMRDGSVAVVGTFSRLMRSAFLNRAARAAELIDSLRANVGARNSHGRTALHFAALGDAPDAARALLARGAQVDSRASNGFTALHFAASFGCAAAAAVLLASGADVNARASGGERPLHVAAGRGLLEMCSLLLSHGADVRARLALSGSTAARHAAAKGKAEVAAMLEGAEAASI